MKLRNKKTGEIIDIYKGEITLHYNQGRKIIHFKHLEDLEEWEDYQEPKEYYFIRSESLTVGYSPISNTRSCRNRKEIGNYFDTREEAEKAVEKLKAWKRLKDKGFSLDAVVDTFFCLDIFIRDEPYEEIKDDLKIVFGGEE